MIIVHIFHGYYPAVGGMERAVQGLAEGQTCMGHEVHVVTYRIKGTQYDEMINGIHIHRIKGVKLHFPDLTYPLELPQLDRVDVIHAHGQNSLFSLTLAKRLRERLGARLAFHFMAIDTLHDHPNLAIRLLGPHYGRWAVKKAIEIADIPLVKNPRDLEILRRRYGVEAHLLPDGIPTHYLTTPKADPHKFRERHGISHDHLFLYVGRMHPLKGPHVLVEALKYVPKAAAVLIGPGNWSPIRRLAKALGVHERTYVLGPVDEQTKIDAIDAAEALVLPSLSHYVEVYPMVISEAWARERPVIASAVGGIPYRVRHGQNGLLVEPRNPRALAEAIKKVVEDPDHAGKMGRAGRREVVTWEEVAKLSIKLYEDRHSAEGIHHAPGRRQ